MSLSFNIISLGDVEFLGQILNAVAMVCGTGDFKTLCACGALVGLLYIGFQCIFQGGQRINLQHTLVCFICYLCFFGPTCTVTIEDAQRSSYTRVVDNVPLGVGVSGMAISSIGYGVTKIMEQAFGDYARTSDFQYIEPLKILTDLRNASFSDDIWRELDTECGGCDTRRAVINYLSECTMPGMRAGDITLNSLANSSYANGQKLSAFRWDSKAHVTYLPITSGGALVGTNKDGYVTCADGWAIITNNVFAKTNTTNVVRRLNNMVHAYEYNGTTRTTPTTLSRINDAFTALGVSGATAQDYIIATIINPVYSLASQRYYKNNLEADAALAVSTASVQRDTQWASEHSMFVSSARAFIAFFEGFVYAITPIMGFLMLTGAFGLALVGKFFMVLAWIQLWLPCMAICNLYTIAGARSEMIQSGFGSGTIFDVNNVYNSAEHWASVGGMLFAATPMLALFLISGSMLAFTSIAGRLSGRDHFNEKIAAPDAIQPGAVQNLAPRSTFNSKEGAIDTGASIPSLQVAAMGQAMVAGSVQNIQRETQSLLNTLQETGGASRAMSHSKMFKDEFGEIFRSSNDSQISAARQALVSQAKAMGANHDQAMQIAEQMAYSLAGSGSGSIGFGSKSGKEKEDLSGMMSKISASLGITLKGEGSSTSGQSNGTSRSQSKNFNDSTSSSGTDSLSATLSKGLSATFGHMSSDSWSDLAKHDDNASRQNAYSRMADTARSSSFSKSLGESMAASRNINLAQATREMQRVSSEQGSHVWKFLQQYKTTLSDAERAQFSKEEASFMAMLNGDGQGASRDPRGISERATAMAALSVMSQKKDFQSIGYALHEAGLIHSTSDYQPQIVKGADPKEGQRIQEAVTKKLEAAETRINEQDAALPGAPGKTKAVEDINRHHGDGVLNTQLQKRINDGSVRAPAIQEKENNLFNRKDRAGIGMIIAAHGGSPSELVNSIRDKYNNRNPFDAKRLTSDEFTDLTPAQFEYGALLGHKSMFSSPTPELANSLMRAQNKMKEEYSQAYYNRSYDALEGKQKDHIDGVTNAASNAIEAAGSSTRDGQLTEVRELNRALGLKEHERSRADSNSILDGDKKDQNNNGNHTPAKKRTTAQSVGGAALGALGAVAEAISDPVAAATAPNGSDHGKAEYGPNASKESVAKWKEQLAKAGPNGIGAQFEENHPVNLSSAQAPQDVDANKSAAAETQKAAEAASSDNRMSNANQTQDAGASKTAEANAPKQEQAQAQVASLDSGDNRKASEVPSALNANTTAPADSNQNQTQTADKPQMEARADKPSTIDPSKIAVEGDQDAAPGMRQAASVLGAAAGAAAIGGLGFVAEAISGNAQAATMKPTQTGGAEAVFAKANEQVALGGQKQELPFVASDNPAQTATKQGEAPKADIRPQNQPAPATGSNTPTQEAKLETSDKNNAATKPASQDGKQNTQTNQSLGTVSAKHTSGDQAGRIGRNRNGAAYGTYQMGSNGTVQSFLKQSGYGEQFKGMQAGSADFNQKWQQLAKSDANFAKAQHDFVKASHYDKAMDRLKSQGIDLSGRGQAVQEAVFSTAVQFGAGNGKTGASGVISAALAGKDLSKMSDKDIVSAIQDRKIAKNDQYFRSSDAGTRQATLARAKAEKQELTAMAGGKSAPQPQPATHTSPAVDMKAVQSKADAILADAQTGGGYSMTEEGRAAEAVRMAGGDASIIGRAEQRLAGTGSWTSPAERLANLFRGESAAQTQTAKSSNAQPTPAPKPTEMVKPNFEIPATNPVRAGIEQAAKDAGKSQKAEAPAQSVAGTSPMRSKIESAMAEAKPQANASTKQDDVRNAPAASEKAGIPQNTPDNIGANSVGETKPLAGNRQQTVSQQEQPKAPEKGRGGFISAAVGGVLGASIGQSFAQTPAKQSDTQSVGTDTQAMGAESFSSVPGANAGSFPSIPGGTEGGGSESFPSVPAGIGDAGAQSFPSIPTIGGNDAGASYPSVLGGIETPSFPSVPGGSDGGAASFPSVPGAASEGGSASFPSIPGGEGSASSFPTVPGGASPAGTGGISVPPDPFASPELKKSGWSSQARSGNELSEKIVQEALNPKTNRGAPPPSNLPPSRRG